MPVLSVKLEICVGRRGVFFVLKLLRAFGKKVWLNLNSVSFSAKIFLLDYLEIFNIIWGLTKSLSLALWHLLLGTDQCHFTDTECLEAGSCGTLLAEWYPTHYLWIEACYNKLSHLIKLYSVGLPLTCLAFLAFPRGINSYLGRRWLVRLKAFDMVKVLITCVQCFLILAITDW